ncbi:hypothetical protein PvNV_086 [Penaeus vannamei nudivirus]|nr:hypothetical protein PvSNPV_086 [Penaeus vannamei nucleopolyhedrovirus]
MFFIKIFTIFIFADSIMNTSMWDCWKTYKIDMLTLSSNINKKLLYSLNTYEIILAFTYDIIRVKSTKKLMVIFKILPHPRHTNLKNLWKKHYLNPQELTALNIDLNVYICKELFLDISPNYSKPFCGECGKVTFQEEGYCLNTKCSRAEKNFKFSKYVTNKGGKITKTLNSITDTNEDNYHCKMCESCKVCKRLKKKCLRHKVCKHNQKNKKYFHMINKLAYKYSDD